MIDFGFRYNDLFFHILISITTVTYFGRHVSSHLLHTICDTFNKNVHFTLTVNKSVNNDNHPSFQQTKSINNLPELPIPPSFHQICRIHLLFCPSR